MNISVQHTFPMTREDLWSLLHDPVRLAQCIPGCETLEEVEPDRYTAIMKIGVASIKGTYNGKVEIADKQAPSRYKLVVEGSAAPGFVRGAADMELSIAEDGQTLLSMNAEAEVGGLLASVGQRFLGGIAKQMTKAFFKNIEREAIPAVPDSAEQEAE